MVCDLARVDMPVDRAADSLVQCEPCEEICLSASNATLGKYMLLIQHNPMFVAQQGFVLGFLCKPARVGKDT